MSFSRLKPYFIIAFVAVVAYWQIAFLQAAVKWDMVDFGWPWRYFIGQCLKNHVLPLWNPFQACGYPIYADLSTPVWSPEAWLTGYFADNSLAAVQHLFVFYVALAGWGMYKLLLYWVKNSQVALLFALVFILSGFFVAHVQHFLIIISGAWVPWLAYYFLQMLDPGALRRRMQAAFKAAIVLYLIVTTGYATFIIISAYLLGGIFLFRLKNDCTRKNQLLLAVAVFAGTALLLCLPIVVSFVQVQNHIERLAGGVPLKNAAIGPFTCTSFIAFIAPYSTSLQGWVEYFKTDISMVNVYVGLLVLVLLPVGLYKRENNTLLLLALALLLTAIGMGTQLPFFKWSRQLPLLSYFRFPGFYMYFSCLLLLIAAAQTFAKAYQDFQSYKRPLLISSCCWAMLLLVLCFKWAHANPFAQTLQQFLHSDYTNQLKGQSIGKNTLLSLFAQLLFLVAFALIFLIAKARNAKAILYCLSCITVVEMVVSVQGNLYKTGAGDHPPSFYDKQVSKQPKGFPRPSLTQPLSAFRDAGRIDGLWRNTNNFTKTISPDIFASFKMIEYEHLKDSFPQLFTEVISHPVAYLEPKSAAAPVSSEALRCTGFNPNFFKFETAAAQPTSLHLIQTNYENWQVTIDGQPTRQSTFALNFMAVEVPAGQHTVEFKFVNHPMVAAVIFSWALLIGLLVWLLFFAPPHHEARQ